MRYLFALGLGALLGPVDAQYAEQIRSGRPGIAIGTYCVGAGVVQFEQGVTSRGYDVTPGVDEPAYAVRSLSTTHDIRFGVLSNFEVSALFVLQRDDFTGADRPGSTSGLSESQIALRYTFTEESPTLPALAVETRLLLRAQSEAYRRPATGVSTTLSAVKSIGEQFGAAANLALTHGGEALGLEATYAGVLEYNPTERLGFFVEGYGAFDAFDLNADAGLNYYLTPDVKLDASAGWQSFSGFPGDPGEESGDYFIDAGVSWRIVPERAATD